MLTTLRLSAWGFQYLTILLSLTCLAALIILLVHFDQEPVFTWKGITLNTIISILSVTMKAALAYVVSECMAQWKWILFSREERPLIDFDRIDSATRGPLGSLRVLLKTRGAIAVQFGAILTLLAVALDPLAQQLIQFRQGIILMRSNQQDSGLLALNSRAQSYSMGTAITTKQQVINSTKSNYFSTTEIPVSMQAAILNGLSRSPWEIEQEALVQCSTSNCTWDRFNTLGICHRCNDLTSNLKRVEDFGDALVAIANDVYSGYVIPSTAFTLPNGHFIANIDGCPPYNGRYADCENGQLLGIYSDEKYAITSFGTGNPNKTVSMKDIDTLLWSMSVIYPDLDLLNTSVFTPGKSNRSSKDTLKLWPDIPMKATECALYYCVKQVNSAVEENILIEKITEAPGMRREPESWERADEFEDALSDSVIPQDEISSLEFNKIWSAVSYSDLLLEFPDNTSEPYYRISQYSIKSLSAHMQEMFLANWTNEPQMRVEIEKKLGREAVGFNGASFGPVDESLMMKAVPAALNGLWSWKRYNTSRIFYTLATSMTNEMRRNWQPGQSQDQKTGQDSERFQDETGTLNYYGKVGISTVVYEIRWAWIALHGVMTLSVVIFLAVTLWHSDTRGGGVPLWKSSSLAAIKHGRDVGGVLERTMTVGDMEDKARKTYIKVPKEEEYNENTTCIMATEVDR